MRVFVTGGSGFIGTNLVAALRARGDAVLDYSLTEPLNPAHRDVWRRGDILQAADLAAAVAGFRPDALIHLAARTDCVETTTVEEGYRANTDGTANVLAAIRATPSITRAVITSSQFVCGPGRLPQGDEDYFPHTVYGHSKVRTEQLTRAAGLPCTWTLVRPANIWGPWHQRYVREFWRIAARGLYVHPAGAPVVRTYGYVGNVVAQVLRILELPPASVNGRTFYVGDASDDIYAWASGFCVALCGRRAPRVPRALLRAAGLAGDLISAATGRPFYITSSRCRSMVTDYPTPIAASHAVIGTGPFSLDDGIRETVQWLRGTNALAGAGAR
jgi:nucleoside-diphosphate-sugar epimerase